jgi:hypothetical protein
MPQRVAIEASPIVGGRPRRLVHQAVRPGQVLSPGAAANASPARRRCAPRAGLVY